MNDSEIAGSANVYHYMYLMYVNAGYKLIKINVC